MGEITGLPGTFSSLLCILGNRQSFPRLQPLLNSKLKYFSSFFHYMPFNFNIFKKSVTEVNQQRKQFVSESHFSVNNLIFKLFFCLSQIVISIPCKYTGPFIFFLMTIDLSPASDLIPIYSSLERLEYLLVSSEILKSSVST